MVPIHHDLKSSGKIMTIIIDPAPNLLRQDAPSSPIQTDHLIIPMAIHEGHRHLVGATTEFMRLSMPWKLNSCIPR